MSAIRSGQTEMSSNSLNNQPSGEGPVLAEKYVSFTQQLKALLIRNGLIKWRQRTAFLMQMLMPMLFIFLQYSQPKREDFRVTNETSIVGRLYLENGTISKLKPNWYIVNNGVFNDRQMRQFVALVQISTKVICNTQDCRYQNIEYNTTFEHEQEFNEFSFGQSLAESAASLAIVLNSFNESFSRYTIRLPGSDGLSTTTLLEVCYKKSAESCSSYRYFESSFSLVQAAVDSSILSLRYSQLLDMAPSNEEYSIKMIPNFEIGVFPRANEVDDQFLYFMVPVSFILNFALISKDLITEKEKRIKDCLLMMGLNITAYSFSWAIIECLLTVPPAIAWTTFLLAYMKTPINPILLFIFIQTAAFSFTLLAFLGSCFFYQVKTSQIFTLIASFLLFGALYQICKQTPIPDSFIFKVLFFISPFPCTATLREIIHSRESITFSNMFSALYFPYGYSLLALVFDCAFYFYAALFIDYLYYNSTVADLLEMLFSKKATPSDRFDLSLSQQQNYENVEPVTEDFQGKKAIDIENIVKTFGGLAAIKGITMQLYESQITAFLGPNGAGKTTLLRILTGELRPTSGKVTIYGRCVQNSTDLWKIRTHFGICPQEDIFMEGLTPPEHLYFIAKMKGLSDSEAKHEAKHMMEILELTEQSNTQSENLSGGQKRKLCVAMAVIAQSKVIFLDEPSSGVDPYSRRKIWAALQSLKKDRVIILTTHFMDEADILSDRKAFIIKGKLHCFGSSLFLKSKFGVGYHLRIEAAFEDGGDQTKSAINGIIRGKVPCARLDRTTNSEMIFTLPKDEASLFPALFKSLDHARETGEINIKDYGITMTTLEDVFLNICHDDDTAQIDQSLTTHQVPIESNCKDTLKQTEYHFDLVVAFFYLVRIRCLVMLRDSSFMLVFGVYSIFIFAFADYAVNQQSSSQERLLVLSTALYDNKTLLYKTQTADFSEAINSLKHYCTPKAVKNFTVASMKDAIYAVDIATNDTVSAIFYDVNHLHSLPILQNLVSNLYANKWLRQPFHIETVNRPLASKMTNVSESLTSIVLYLYVLASAFTSVPATLAAQSVKERDTEVKNYLKASGISSLMYWCSFFLVHSIIFGGLCAFTCGLTLWAFSLEALFGDWQFWFILITMNVLFTFNSLLASYVFSYLFKKTETAESYLGLINYLLIGAVIAIWIIAKIFLKEFLSFISFLLLLICPFASPLVGYYTLYSSALTKKVEDGFNLSSTKISYFSWEQIFLPNILALSVGMVFYLVLLFMIEQADSIFFCKVLFWKGKKQPVQSTKLKNDDPDVQKEAERVQKFFNGIQSGGKAPLLLLKELTKTYNDKIAVNSLSLAVENGQIFGLLGSNGAGKTTTMRIICNDEIATSGDVFISGKQMTENTSRTELLSYCPQNNPLWGDITLREHLALFAAIRGVPSPEIVAFTESLIEILAIGEHASKRSSNLSGGTKRKLCLLISIIGNVNLVLLDEPSTGMDPNSKRLMWDLITSHFEPNGPKSAILTTHSMEEADALSTRMAIMRKGVVQCLGTIQHLKNKFGSGYILEVSFKPTFDGDKIYLLAKEQLFPNVRIFEKLKNNIKLEVPQTDIGSMALVFETLQRWLLQFKGDIEEYSFCQSSIELVFIRFAGKDTD